VRWITHPVCGVKSLPQDAECESMRESISAGFDDELSTLARDRLVRHLDRCDACVRFEAQLAVLIGLLRDSPLPPSARTRVKEARVRSRRG
jgi:hypothetical protein